MTRKQAALIFILDLIVPVATVITTVLIALILSGILIDNGKFPSGDNVYFHIHKGIAMYDSWMNAVPYPILDTKWYNGTELFRYASPIPSVLFAFFMFINMGNAFGGYLVYILMLFILGAVVWLRIGLGMDRPILGYVIGMLMFFMPNNLYMLFIEGNLSGTLFVFIMPLYLYFMYRYLETGKWRYMVRFIPTLTILILTDMEYTVMLLIATALFWFVHYLINHRFRLLYRLFGGILISYMISAIWFVPYFLGDSTLTVGNFDKYFQSLFISVFPPLRIVRNNEVFYFGLAVLLLIIFGMLCAGVHSVPGFVVSFILFFLSSKMMKPLMVIIPGSEYLLMIKYFSIALGFCFLSFIRWRTLKKWIQILVIALLIVDIIPSLSVISGYQDKTMPSERLEKDASDTLIGEAKEISKQRIALLDMGDLGSKGSFLVTDFEGDLECSHGGYWDAAITRRNVMNLDMALQDGYYPYLFDRCLDMGCDSVLIKKGYLIDNKIALTSFKGAAERLGYKLADKNDDWLLYHIGTKGRFGVKSKYKGIGIGNSAYSISLAYPNVEETSDPNLNHYTFEELSAYEIVYLSGFTYDSLTDAEELVKKLSDSGVRIVVLADEIPENKNSRTKTFLGVTANIISFENGYPELETTDYGVLNVDLFPLNYAHWDCYYMDGLDKVKGSLVDEGAKIDFYGTVYNDNITFLGLNIPLYYYVTLDESMEKVMNDVMHIDPEELPKRELVPLEIEYGPDSLKIVSPKDGVNTTISYPKDAFEDSEGVYNKNNLTVVDSGEHIIQMVYPHIRLAVGISIFGLFCYLSYIIYLYRRSRD